MRVHRNNGSVSWVNSVIRQFVPCHSFFISPHLPSLDNWAPLISNNVNHGPGENSNTAQLRQMILEVDRLGLSCSSPLNDSSFSPPHYRAKGNMGSRVVRSDNPILGCGGAGYFGVVIFSWLGHICLLISL